MKLRRMLLREFYECEAVFLLIQCHRDNGMFFFDTNFFLQKEVGLRIQVVALQSDKEDYAENFGKNWWQTH